LVPPLYFCFVSFRVWIPHMRDKRQYLSFWTLLMFFNMWSPSFSLQMT
jgi:hypothetical protein